MTRIVFNGQEYSSRDAMPEDVRREYDQAMAMLRGVYPDGVPGAPDLSGNHTVVNVERKLSFSFKPADASGDEYLPEPIRRLVEPPPAGGVPDALHTSFGMMLAFAAGFVLVFAIGLMFVLGGGPRHLPGRLVIAVAALFLLGGIDTMATRLARRRESLLGPDSPAYRRFVVWSAAGLATAAVVLLGLAWYLP